MIFFANRIDNLQQKEKKTFYFNTIFFDMFPEPFKDIVFLITPNKNI